MADQQRKPKVSPLPDLHHDLVRAVYEVGEREGVLKLKDRLRALAVCRAWKEALSSLPVSALRLTDDEKDMELCNWVIQRQPTVISLQIYFDIARALPILATLQGHGLLSLGWGPPARGPLQIVDALPRPLAHLFPSLRQLHLSRLVVASTWLCQLSSLRALRALFLGVEGLTDAATAGAAVRFPPLPSLAYLNVSDWPGPAELHIQLDDLPALTDLSLWEGRFALQASRPAPQLQRLLSRAEHMAVDVAALPCLRSAEISTSCRHERPASIAAATALTYLALQNLRFLEWDPSTLELLRSLPPSVSCLTMREKWPQEAADVLGGLTSLVGLVLDGRGPLPAEGAPLWAGLRALDCSPLAVEDEEGDVPKQPEEVDFRVQALRRASKLEVLQVDLDEPTIHDADLLTSLPALRRLVIPAGLSAAGMSDPAATAMLNVCCRAMPQVEFLLPVYRVRDEEFFKLMW